MCLQLNLKQKIKIYNLTKIFKEILYSIVVIATIGLASIIAIYFLLTLMAYFNLKSNFTEGFFILLTALITSVFAIQKYHREQRTLRIQKLYFEDTFIGQARYMEEILSQKDKNMFLAEKAYNTILHLLKQRLPINVIKNTLIMVFDNFLENLGTELNTTTFKCETISILLYGSGDKKNEFTSWLTKFPCDVQRFFIFLQGQIFFLKTHITTDLNENNFCNLEKLVRDTIGTDRINNNYLLINRHEILFSLLAEIVLELSSTSYTTTENLKKDFNKNPKIKKIIDLINDSYSSVIVCNDFNFGAITDTQAVQLREKIHCMWKIIGRELWNNS